MTFDRPPMTPPKPEKRETPTVPEFEVGIDFVRSSGPGGQKVNKTSSKAQLRWNVGNSAVFTDEEKEKIRAHVGNRLNNEDEVVLHEQGERSQTQNRESVIRRLNDLVTQALTPEKERKATKPSYSQKQKRLDEKRKEGRKKQERKFPKGEW